MPNWNSSGMPVTIPIVKLIPKIRIQNRAAEQTGAGPPKLARARREVGHLYLARVSKHHGEVHITGKVGNALTSASIIVELSSFLSKYEQSFHCVHDPLAKNGIGSHRNRKSRLPLITFCGRLTMFDSNSITVSCWCRLLTRAISAACA